MENDNTPGKKKYGKMWQDIRRLCLLSVLSIAEDMEKYAMEG